MLNQFLLKAERMKSTGRSGTSNTSRRVSLAQKYEFHISFNIELVRFPYIVSGEFEP
jgi:hypothetical protein